LNSESVFKNKQTLFEEISVTNIIKNSEIRTINQVEKLDPGKGVTQYPTEFLFASESIPDFNQIYFDELVAVIFDIENEAELLKNVFNDLTDLKCHINKNNRRTEFIFKNSNKSKDFNTKVLMISGCTGWYRKVQINELMPSKKVDSNEVGINELSYLPIYFEQLKKWDKDEPHAPLPILGDELVRSSVLGSHYINLAKAGYNDFEILEIGKFINRYFISPQLSEDEVIMEKNLSDLIVGVQKKSELFPLNDSTHKLGLIQNDEKTQVIKVGDLLPDAPITHLVLPINYNLSDEATYKVTIKANNSNIVEIAFAPVLVTGIMKDIQTNLEMVRLAWKRGGRWYHKIVNRELMANARKIIELSSEGFPVTSNNANEIVKYLEVTEATNYGLLPKQYVSSQLGWQGSELEKGFLWGEFSVLEDKVIKQTAFNGNNTSEEVVIFRGMDIGDEQIAKGFHMNGSIEKWIKAVQLASEYPKVLLGLYSAFVPPLLEILNCSNFIIDFANRTSTGKTTIQRIAASVVGNPDEKCSNSVLGTWDTTIVWLERASSIITCLPMLLDDTKRAKKPKDVADILYTVANGRGRGRGNLKGISQIKTWFTVLISSGEIPATSFTNDGGTRARVLEIRGLPFGSDDKDTQKLVQTINREVCQNYGHAFPLFVQWIQRKRNEWEIWNDEYQQKVNYFSSLARDNVSGRLAAYAAIIEFTAQLVHRAFKEMGYELPWKYEGCMMLEWPNIAREAEDPTGEENALREIVSWAYSREKHFYGRHETDNNGKLKLPSGGWLGRWDNLNHWKYIAFYPSALKAELERNGYNPKEILNLWNEKNWLDTQTGRFEKSIRVNGERQWVVALKREAIESLP
jgi:putative DNA primase/helicase